MSMNRYRLSRIAVVSLFAAACAFSSLGVVEAQEGGPEVRLDRLGDPLPAGATTRIGTIRFRGDGPQKKLLMSADRKFMASLNLTSSVEIWDLSRGVVSSRFTPEIEGVADIALSPDGTRLAIAGEGAVELWDLESESRQATLVGTDGALQSVIFSPKGDYLVAGNDDRAVLFWDLNAEEPEAQYIEAHDGGVTDLLFASKGKVLLSSGSDGKVKAWKFPSMKLSKSFDPHNGSVVFSLIPGVKGKSFATSGSDGIVKIWDLRRFKNSRSIVVGQATPSVVFGPGNKTLVGAQGDRVKVWSARTGKVLQDLPSIGSSSVVVNSRTGRIFSGGVGMGTWDLDTGTDLLGDYGHRRIVRAVDFAQGGRTLATGGDEDEVYLWETDSGHQLQVFPGHQRVYSIKIAPNNSVMAVGGSSKRVHLYDLNSGASQDFIGHNRSIASLAFSPDSRKVASGSFDASIKIWDTRSGKELHTFYGDLGVARALSWSNDGLLLASALHADWFSDDKESLVVWHAKNGALLFRFAADQGAIISLAFSPDGKQLAAGCEDGSIRILDVASSREVARLVGHGSHVRALAWSNDGRWIASGSTDKSVRLWDAVSFDALQIWEGHTAEVHSVSFSPNGSKVASSGADATALVWEVFSPDAK